MQLAGRTVRFWLSAVGKLELSGVIRQQDVIEAYVADEDDLGVWIWLPDEPGVATEGLPIVTLLRWAHFWTASVEYIPQTPADRAKVGFRP